MNNFDLDAKLKSISLPERPEDYWNHFPSKVRANLRRAAMKPAADNFWLPRRAWSGGFALAMALVFICIQFHTLQSASVAINKQERHIHAQLAQLDAGLHTLMLNTHGMGYLLGEVN
jgi:hypothetical protein